MKKLRLYFLQAIGAVYLFAFASLYVQVPGLYGNKGILPAKAILKPEPRTFDEFFEQPSLIRFSEKFGLDVEEAMDACCIIGIFLSSLTFIFHSCQTTAVYAVLWILYLSLYEVGQTFLWFQWDILLLEAGFLSIFIANVGLIGPYNTLPAFPHSSIAMVLVRWLLFRLMFTSGVVKLQSKCPTWWGLTALNYHYETQCIPTPLAWYAHQLPDWFQKFSVASTFLIQIPMALLFFAPFSALVQITLYAQVFLQLLILLTGNYNFFNLTTLALCLSLADGGKIYHNFFGLVIPRAFRPHSLRILVNIIGSVGGIIGIGYLARTYFSMRFEKLYPPILFSKLAFNESDLAKFVDAVVPLAIFLVASMLTMAIVTALAKAIFPSKKTSIFLRAYRLVATFLFSLLAIYLFIVACVPFCRGLNRHLPTALVDLGAWHSHNDITQKLNLPITSSYGLFRRMTGVGGRPEVIIEASLSSPDGPWLPYEFIYKPGDISVMPPVVAPHQPRLDWQMWFAALSSAEHSPWFISLCERLLSAEPSVLALLAKAPFGDKKPAFIRAKLYHYHFSSDVHSKQWWRRQLKTDYLPVVDRDALQSHVENMRVSEESLPDDRRSVISGFIGASRRAIGSQPEGFFFIAVIFSTLVVTKFLLTRRF